MTPKTFVSGVLLLIAATTAAEEADERQRMYERYLEFPSYIRSGSVAPHWLDDGSSFWYAEGMPDQTVIYRVDPAAGTKETIFDVDRLRAALTPVLGHEPPYGGLPFDRFSYAEGGQSVEFEVAEQRFRLRLDDYRMSHLPGLSDAEKDRVTPRLVRPSTFPGFPGIYELPSPDRRWFALEKDHDLWLRSATDGRSIRLTQDGTADFDWKIQQDDLWNGARWSSDGLRLAAIKEDRRGIPQEPVVHWLKTHPEVEWIPFPKAGEKLPRSELWIIDVMSKHRIRIETGDDLEQYFHLIGWSPEGESPREEVLFLAASRDFKRLRVMAADPRTGASRQILEEKQSTFIKNLSINPGWNELFTLLPKSRRFLWTSERDGWDHLYLYDIEGTLIRRLTQGEFPVLQVVAVDEADEDSGWVYFTAHAETRVYDTHLYRVALDGGPIERLTEAPGQHRVAFSPSKQWFLDTHSHLDRPPRVDLRSASGELIMALSEADVSGLDEIHWQPPEEFVVKAADGTTDLWGVLWKPWNFDPTKKYPVIEHIYGGPFIAYTPRGFTGGAYRGTYGQALAQLGYIVFMVDNRGTPERGKTFQDVVYKNFGQHEVPDHVAVLEQLAAERPYMDLDRVGLFGGSWGAYMTVRAMLLAPEVYRAGVAVNGVYDFIDHGATGLEGYLGGPPQEGNLEAYEAGSSLALADNLEGELLLIHATSDINASFSATMKMVDALIRADKHFDLIVLPGEDHHPKGQSQRYRLEAHRRFFAEHLRP